MKRMHGDEAVADSAGRGGFTLVELIVVIGMLMLLAGAVTTSVAGARRRAKIQQATAEAQEMTKAILAFENYGSLASHLIGESKPEAATVDNLKFILGKVRAENTGQQGNVPVLFNASATRDGRILDPWGRPYRVMMRKGRMNATGKSLGFTPCVSFPNYNRRPAAESLKTE